MFKNLKITYDNENGERITLKCLNAKEFVSLIDSEDNIDILMLDYENVEAVFFENTRCITKHYNTIEDLYNYCINIVK